MEQMLQSKSSQGRNFMEELELQPAVEEGVEFPWARRGWTMFHDERTQWTKRQGNKNIYSTVGEY
jgi:hypothetical protein